MLCVAVKQYDVENSCKHDINVCEPHACVGQYSRQLYGVKDEVNAGRTIYINFEHNNLETRPQIGLWCLFWD